MVTLHIHEGLSRSRDLISRTYEVLRGDLIHLNMRENFLVNSLRGGGLPVTEGSYTPGLKGDLQMSGCR